jgi:RNA polymerase sigma-70 factor (ECF subfamily)
MQPFPGRRRRIRTAARPSPRIDYATLGDMVLVQRAKDGDGEALAALCARHEPRVERICRRLLREREDVQDATQDALARMCQRLHQFRGEAAFSTWLHRLTINTCRDAAARTASRQTVWLDADRRVCAEAGPATRAELGELRGDLAAGLATLPASQAQVVVLKDALGLTFEEISERTGMPVGTAKSYAHRARAGLRVALGVPEP